MKILIFIWCHLTLATMFNKYLCIFLCIIHVKGDMIEIEIETERGHICSSNPAMYRSDIFDRILQNTTKAHHDSLHDRIRQNITKVHMASIKRRMICALAAGIRNGTDDFSLEKCRKIT